MASRNPDRRGYSRAALRRRRRPSRKNEDNNNENLAAVTLANWNAGPVRLLIADSAFALSGRLVCARSIALGRIFRLRIVNSLTGRRSELVNC